MKADGAGRLFVSGGDTGQMFVYDTASGALIEGFDNGQEMTFVNDVTLTPDGSAFFTDSMTPSSTASSRTARAATIWRPT